MSQSLSASRIAFLQSCLLASRQAESLSPPLTIPDHLTLSPNWYLGYGNSPSLRLTEGTSNSFASAPSFSSTPHLLHTEDKNTAALAINGPFARFFVHNPKDEAGYGGSLFTITTTSGESRSFRGPWSSRASAISPLFPSSPALCECSLNCCSALTLRSILHRMSFMDRSVPANITGPGLFGSPTPCSLSNPAGRWALLAHSSLYSPTEFEMYFTPIIIDNNGGYWMKGDDSKHDSPHNTIARGSQICILDPSTRFPLHIPTPSPRPVDSIIPGRVAAIQSSTCMPAPIGCGGPATTFTDTSSRAEYAISGLCQSCQDSIFTPSKDVEGSPLPTSSVPDEDEIDSDDPELDDEDLDNDTLPDGEDDDEDLDEDDIDRALDEPLTSDDDNEWDDAETSGCECPPSSEIELKDSSVRPDPYDTF